MSNELSFLMFLNICEKIRRKGGVLQIGTRFELFRYNFYNIIPLMHNSKVSANAYNYCLKHITYELYGSFISLHFE